MAELNVAAALAKALTLYFPWQEVPRSCIQCEQRAIGLAVRHTWIFSNELFKPGRN
jgi:hypothetical protein